MSNPALAAAMRTAARSPCALCGDRPYIAGVFTPSDPQRFGAPTGKARLVVYTLCQSCWRLPDRTKRAEDVILADLAAEAAR